MNYTDISILEISEPCFRDIAGDSIDDLKASSDCSRVMVKWDGECPTWLKALNPVIRSHGEAKSYYTRQNGWI
jgi:hypothetical protein